MFAFTTSPEQQKYVTALRAFVAQEITPIALEHDRLGTTPLHVYANFCGEGFSEPFFRGDDAPRPPYLVTFCLAGEELGYGCTGIGKNAPAVAAVHAGRRLDISLTV